MSIITVGNTKGGCGKSTFAVLLAQYLSLKQKINIQNNIVQKPIGIIDFDIPQYTTNTFFKNRIKHLGINNIIRPDIIYYDFTGWNFSQENLKMFIKKEEENFSYLIIDSGGHHDNMSGLAIEIADILITPVISSILDLNVLCNYDTEKNIITTGSYTQFVRSHKNKLKKLSWFVVPNRCSNIPTIYANQCLNVLNNISPLIGFKLTSSIIDRSIYSQGFDSGITCLDEEMEYIFYNNHNMIINARREISLIIENIINDQQY
jgi:cellulose biosynthesis protein BcsQ